MTKVRVLDYFTRSFAGLTPRVVTGGRKCLHPIGEGLKTLGELFRQTFWPRGGRNSLFQDKSRTAYPQEVRLRAHGNRCELPAGCIGGKYSFQ
jgi:hypothetical protein